MTWRSAPRVRARVCVVSLAPVLAALVALTAGGLGAAHIAPAQVARVVDGDTISVRLADGDRDTVRLTGVDTPETVHPTQGVEPYGPEAAAYTRARLTGATVRPSRTRPATTRTPTAVCCGTSCSRRVSTSMRPSSAKGTPPLFGPSRTPGTLRFYSWKPRRAPRAMGPMTMAARDTPDQRARREPARRPLTWFDSPEEQALIAPWNAGRGAPLADVQHAAEQGHAQGQLNLADAYHHGEGVEKNPDEAEQWYRRAADRLDCLIAQLDGREARLNAAADRAERNRLALAAHSGDPTPEELAAGTRTTDRVLAPNTVTTDKESRPDAE